MFANTLIFYYYFGHTLNKVSVTTMYLHKTLCNVKTWMYTISALYPINYNAST